MPNFGEQLEALKDADRRTLLFTLRDSDPEDEVLEEVNGGEQTSDELGFRVTMRHTHLPKLDNYGFINWERETAAVEKGPAFDEIEPLLDVLDANQDRLPLDIEY